MFSEINRRSAIAIATIGSFVIARSEATKQSSYRILDCFASLAMTFANDANHSSAVSRLALPPAAAVLIVTVCSVAKRRR